MTDLLQVLSEIAKLPEGERGEMLDKLARAVPREQVTEAAKKVLAQKSHEDTREGYDAFYELLHGFPPPEHIKREIDEIFAAHEDGMGCLIFAWRGSWKSVSISVTFLAWRIGLEPKKTHVVVGANDDTAEKVTGAVAAIIELHPAWKETFPTVVPNTGKWGVEGYSVIDNSISREQWTDEQSGVIDPTLVGGGWESSRLIGKHPTGCLIIDDIHDPKNSSSLKQREAIVHALTTGILKTTVKKDDKLLTWLIAVGTPWALDDAYYTMKNTGQYRFISIPAMKRAPDGEGVYLDGKNRDGVVFEDVQGWWELTAPANFGANSVIYERSFGKAQFWQMIMLDLATAESGRLRYYTYAFEKDEKGFPRDKFYYPTVGGVDPTNTFSEDANEKSSYFALAYVSKLPSGGAVVVDGVLERCSQLQAENYILAAQGKFSNWLYAAVENVGGGAGFIQTLQRNPAIRVVPSGIKGVTDAKVKSKKDRVLELARWFEDSTVRISDEDTPFLNALRRLFDKFWDLDPKHDYSFDAWDATYHALKNLPDVLVVNKYVGEEKSKPHPLKGLASYRGY